MEITPPSSFFTGLLPHSRSLKESQSALDLREWTNSGEHQRAGNSLEIVGAEQRERDLFGCPPAGFPFPLRVLGQRARVQFFRVWVVGMTRGRGSLKCFLANILSRKGTETERPKWQETEGRGNSTTNWQDTSFHVQKSLKCEFSLSKGNQQNHAYFE